MERDVIPFACLAWRLSIVAASLSLGAGGCGGGRPETAVVTGTVTLDGKAVDGAAVGFHPEAGGHPAEGITDAEGRFRLSTFEPGDGALLGKHTVTVTKRRVIGAKANDQGEDTGAPVTVEWVVPRKYSSRATSGLTREVIAGGNDFAIELTSP